MSMKEAEIYVDGASKGNPGPSGIGVVIVSGSQTVENISHYIGSATNNIAEYSALRAGLEKALALGVTQIKIKSDSQLLCRQLKREYKIKSPHLLKLYQEVFSLLFKFDTYSVAHIPREENRGADKLANLAIKKALKRSK